MDPPSKPKKPHTTFTTIIEDILEEARKWNEEQAFAKDAERTNKPHIPHLKDKS